MSEKKGGITKKKFSNDFKNIIKKLDQEIESQAKFSKNCRRCGQQKNQRYYPQGKNPFFPDYKANICFECLDEIIDTDNVIEVQYVLTLLFLPYIEDLWYKTLSDYEKPLGRYLLQLNLIQYRDYEPGIINRLKKQMDDFDSNPYESRANLLTKSEQSELKSRWGENWDLKDILKMNDYYQEMQDDFNIENKAHDDYLKKIVRTSLVADKKLEEGDAHEYQKLSKIYNDLMKAAEFSAEKKKDKKDSEGLNSVGIIYSLAEKDRFIPKFHNKDEPDIVDNTEKNLKLWMKKLIEGETDLNILLENAAKRVVEQERKEEQLTEYAEIEQLEDGL